MKLIRDRMADEGKFGQPGHLPTHQELRLMLVVRRTPINRRELPHSEGDYHSSSFAENPGAQLQLTAALRFTRLWRVRASAAHFAKPRNVIGQRS